MAERGGQTSTDDTEQTGSGMATVATALAVNATSAGAEGGPEAQERKPHNPRYRVRALGTSTGSRVQSRIDKVNARQRSSHASSGIT